MKIPLMELQHETFLHQESLTNFIQMSCDYNLELEVEG